MLGQFDTEDALIVLGVGAVPVTKSQRLSYFKKRYSFFMGKFPPLSSLWWGERKTQAMPKAQNYWLSQIMAGYDSMAARKHAIDYYHNELGRDQRVVSAFVNLGEIDRYIQQGL